MVGLRGCPGPRHRHWPRGRRPGHGHPVHARGGSPGDNRPVTHAQRRPRRTRGRRCSTHLPPSGRRRHSTRRTHRTHCRGRSGLRARRWSLARSSSSAQGRSGSASSRWPQHRTVTCSSPSSHRPNAGTPRCAWAPTSLANPARRFRNSWPRLATKHRPSHLSSPTSRQSPTVFECVGRPAVVQALLAEAPPHSRIVLADACHEPVEMNPLPLTTNEVTVTTSFAYRPADFATAMRHLSEQP